MTEKQYNLAERMGQEYVDYIDGLLDKEPIRRLKCCINSHATSADKAKCEVLC